MTQDFPPSQQLFRSDEPWHFHVFFHNRWLSHRSPVDVDRVYPGYSKIQIEESFLTPIPSYNPIPSNTCKRLALQWNQTKFGAATRVFHIFGEKGLLQTSKTILKRKLAYKYTKEFWLHLAIAHCAGHHSHGIPMAPHGHHPTTGGWSRKKGTEPSAKGSQFCSVDTVKPNLISARSANRRLFDWCWGRDTGIPNVMTYRF